MHAASTGMRRSECLSVERQARPALQRESGVLGGWMRLPASSREALQGRCRPFHFGVYECQPPKEHFHEVRREESESAKGCPYPRRTWHRPRLLFR